MDSACNQHQFEFIEGYRKVNWGLSKRARPGDLMLIYRCHPEKKIVYAFTLISELQRGKAGWRKGECYYGTLQRICGFGAPVFLEDMKNHRVLQTASFIRRWMQGNLLVSEYWPYLYEMLVARNPAAKKPLAPWAPQSL